MTKTEFAIAALAYGLARHYKHPETKTIACCSLTLVISAIYRRINNKYSQLTLKERIMHWVFSTLPKLPIIGKRIKTEVDQNKKDVAGSFPFGVKDDSKTIISEYQNELNSSPKTVDEVITDLKVLKSSYNKPVSTSKSGNLQFYYQSDELHRLHNAVFDLYADSNMLHVDHFLAARKIEAELCRQITTLYNGDEEACALHTSGGTESIIMAIVAYRNRYQEKHHWAGACPEIIMTKNAHPAFNKAAHYFDMRIRYCPVVEKTQKMNVRKLKGLINSRTVVVVASAPQYPHGVFDPVEEIAEVTRKYGVPLHVDCCLGGMLVPFAEKAGLGSISLFDLKFEKTNISLFFKFKVRMIYI